MKHLIPFVFFMLSSLGLPVVAQSPVVVELFTSQGCPSCPPADKLLHELAQRDDVIPLALHVDYWDYIGWKDEFSHPDYAKRQRGYAVQAKRRSVYTPQMIVNGVTDIVGARRMELSKAIAHHADLPSRVELSVNRSGSEILINAQPTNVDGPLIVRMLRYTPQRSAHITRGENAGHTMLYANVTENWTVLAEWDGTTALALTSVVEGDKPVVVLVQQDQHGPILAAVRLR
ncbi:MAG: DUF1223 domain-containing protein [Tateyamaria sp.]|jgi:hypothetical protein|nr:DUF1223 domain-containing protein [Tateyamaria sp.]